MERQLATTEPWQVKVQEAENFIASGNFENASDILLSLIETPAEPFAYYRLAGIANITKDPAAAKYLYHKAFTLMPNICQFILSKDHPNNGYVYKHNKNEVFINQCPLCNKSGEAYWCYCVLEVSAAYMQNYNPIRTWVYCEDCHHLYAEEFPIQKFEPSNGKSIGAGMPTRPFLFSYYSEILTKLSQFTEGNELFEIGIGGSECILSAQEMGFNVFGLDISEGNVQQAQKYGLDVRANDIMEFVTDQKWDIIIMGDVIEHVSDPVSVMEKVFHLLNDNGLVWISTPNFDGSFSKFSGHADPMRREASHKNYFSRSSLLTLLERFNFIPVDYRISSQYNGSMEIIAIKKVEL